MTFPADDKVSPITEVWRRIKRNPVIIAFFGAALIDVAVAEDVTWRATALAVLGVVTRFFTVPAAEVIDGGEAESIAFLDGFVSALEVQPDDVVIIEPEDPEA